ncbi:hypothetical protein GS38_09435 [Escherichia coli]|nr:hypothetical protein GS38_09435 [Escherichia coli]
MLDLHLVGMLNLRWGLVSESLSKGFHFFFSDKIVFVTDTMRDFICNGNKKALNKSIVVPFFYLSNWKEKILNYDKIKEKRNEQRLLIMHAGSIYGNRDASKFIDALSDHESTIIFKNFGVVNQKIQYSSANIVITSPLPYDDMMVNLKKG